MTLLLDGSEMASEDDFHDAVTAASGVEFYGRNLDALWDLLVGLVDPPIEIRWTNAESSRAAIGERFDRIVAVIRNAQAELGPSSLIFDLQYGA
jgi:RNAse (barnase) inhibitor barstar